VRLVSTGPVRLDDAWIVNTADPRKIELHVDVDNAGAAPATVAWMVHVRDAQGTLLAVDALRAGVTCPPGRTHDALTLPFPDAALWSPATPALHVARFELTTGPDVSTGAAGSGVSLGRVDDAVGVEPRLSRQPLLQRREAVEAVLDLEDSGPRLELGERVGRKPARGQVEAGLRAGLGPLHVLGVGPAHAGLGAVHLA